MPASVPTVPAAPPSTMDLVAAARARLEQDLRLLAACSLSELVRLLNSSAGLPVTLGAVVHVLRGAARDGDLTSVETLFLAILSRVERLNRRWAEQIVENTRRVPRANRMAAIEDAQQELVMHLWEQLVARDSTSWELFFGRALEFAQRHVAARWLRRTPRDQSMIPTLLAASAGDLLTSREALPWLGEAGDPYASAELADLRELVLRLPWKERLVVVLRFWQGAREGEIAAALGGVTPRTVRNQLRRALVRLRAWYAEEGNGDA